MLLCVSSIRTMDTSTNESGSTIEEKYTIKIKNAGNIYSKTLKDVDGNPLTNEWGDEVNVFSKEITRLFKERKIRILHRIDPGYRYFITSSAQLDRFLREREEGAPLEHIKYFVYFDEDMNFNPVHLRDNVIYDRRTTHDVNGTK